MSQCGVNGPPGVGCAPTQNVGAPKFCVTTRLAPPEGSPGRAPKYPEVTNSPLMLAVACLPEIVVLVVNSGASCVQGPSNLSAVKRSSRPPAAHGTFSVVALQPSVERP